MKKYEIQKSSSVTWSWKDKGVASSWESHAHFSLVHFTMYLAMSHQTFPPPVYSLSERESITYWSSEMDIQLTMGEKSDPEKTLVFSETISLIRLLSDKVWVSKSRLFRLLIFKKLLFLNPFSVNEFKFHLKPNQKTKYSIFYEWGWISIFSTIFTINVVFSKDPDPRSI